MRLLRLVRVPPLRAALAAWMIGAAVLSLLPGCGFAGGGVQGCRLPGWDIRETVDVLGMAAPFPPIVALPWFAAMSLVIALVEPRRT